ncbi:toll/interleukin-1 receptor domain-containing protein [Variovorax sp. dw_954]|uniref:toll/interleukin-1 receptor domain-containing protein n=1 Tax=Variovorax sp. dw_954 TaxID=2720078 RepID=UPI001BD3FD37|nr:toll/interleukin-1 receptor domain-containing protein [Variovorax sp. dw_954]
MKHYFVSYNLADKAWAEWVSQQVEALGMSVVMQAWDFEAGDNFVARMHAALQQCERMLLILSRHSLDARFTNEEWQAAFALGQRIVPVRVDDCRPPGLLAPIAYIDLSALDEAAAAQALKAGLQPPRRPNTPVPFPGRRAS